MKHHYILASLIVSLAWGSKLYAGTTKAAPSGSEASINVTVSQKLQGLKLSNEDYHTHKRAIDLLVKEGYGTLAERYYLQEVLGKPTEIVKNQVHQRKHNESP